MTHNVFSGTLNPTQSIGRLNSLKDAERTSQTVTYYNAVVVTENQLLLLLVSIFACKLLVNVYKFHVHVY